MNDLVRRQKAAAEAACHYEQVTIWSGEIVDALSLGDFLKEGLSYGEVADLRVTVKDEIRRIIASAFEHPEAIAALSAGEQMVMVPREPTREMIAAGAASLEPIVKEWADTSNSTHDDAWSIYQAMIAAAPSASSTQTEERS